MKLTVRIDADFARRLGRAGERIAARAVARRRRIAPPDTLIEQPPVPTEARASPTTTPAPVETTGAT